MHLEFAVERAYSTWTTRSPASRVREGRGREEETGSSPFGESLRRVEPSDAVRGLPDVEEYLPPRPGDALCALLEGFEEARVVVRHGCRLENLV